MTGPDPEPLPKSVSYAKLFGLSAAGLIVMFAAVVTALLLTARAPQSGTVTIAITGELEGPGYMVLPSATARTEGAEYSSRVDLRVKPTSYSPTMPTLVVEVGPSGARCTSGKGEGWLQNFDADAGYATLVLLCEPYVALNEFEQLQAGVVLP